MTNIISNEITHFNEYGSSLQSIIQSSKDNPLESYKRRMDELARDSDDAIFDHAGVDQSSIVLEKLIDNTTNQLRILCSNLSGPIKNSPEYLRSINNFIKRGGKISILLDDFESGYSEFLSLLNSNIERESIQVRVFKNNLQIIQNETEKPIHFTIGDDKRYRIEKDTDQLKGSASFNDPEFSKILSTLFDEAFVDEYSKSINLSKVFQESI